MIVQTENGMTCMMDYEIAASRQVGALDDNTDGNRLRNLGGAMSLVVRVSELKADGWFLRCG